MKKYKSSIKLLVIIFAVMFILNMTVMYSVFDINVLNSGAFLQEDLKTAQRGDDGLLTAAPGAKVDDNIGLGESEPANPAEADQMLQPGAFNTAAYYVTSDEIALLGKLSLEDKFSVMTILSKLGREEVNRIYEMSLDGITFAEFADIKASVENMLSLPDAEALKEILDRNKMLYAENGR